MKLYNKAVVYICSILLLCMITGIFSTTLFGDEKHYEIRPEITLPEYKTEMDRVIDAYERVMNNYVNLVEKNSCHTRSEIDNISKELDSINQRLSKLSLQLESIQRKLGIEVLQEAVPSSSTPEEIETHSQP